MLSIDHAANLFILEKEKSKSAQTIESSKNKEEISFDEEQLSKEFQDEMLYLSIRRNQRKDKENKSKEDSSKAAREDEYTTMDAQIQSESFNDDMGAFENNDIKQNRGNKIEI